MFEGYLAFGGGEVINNARAQGYADSYGCGVNWLRGGDCAGLQDALGEPTDYDYVNISDAPWYDERDEPSHRFLGVTGLRFEGLPGSTRDATVAEGIGDGGRVGQLRWGTRRVRVEAMLTARGQDALESGLGWLAAALRPGRCGLHGDACGAADVDFFTACPPTSDTVTSPTVVWNDPVTNLVTNPSMETAAAATTLWTNIATNPSMEATSGTVTVRTNLCTNPNFETNTTGWVLSGAATIARSTAQFHGGVASLSITSTGGNGGAQAPSATVAAGGIYTFSVWVLATAGNAPTSIAVNWYNGGTFLSQSAGPSQVLTIGSWTRVTMTATAPATATAAYFLTLLTGGTISDVRFIDDVLVESADTAQPYFDGSSATGDPDLTASWTGTANASTSVIRGVGVTGVVLTTLRIGYASSAWFSTGTKSLKILGGPNNGDSYAALPVTLVAGQQYTIMGKIRLAAAQTGTMVAAARSLAIQYNGSSQIRSTAAPNAAGVHTISWTVTVPAGATGIGLRAYNGAGYNNGDVWWDDILVVAGGYAGPYFDGAHAYPDTELTTAWTGTANASTSTVSGPGVAGMPAADATQAVRWRSTASPGDRTASARYALAGATADLPATSVLPTTGQPYTLLGKVRASRTQLLTPQIRGAAGTPFTAAAGVWTEFRVSGVAGAGTASQTGLLAGAGQAGDLVDLDAVLLITGDYTGGYFDGSVADSTDPPVDYAWTGTADASTSTMATGSIVIAPDPVKYAALVDSLERSMHTVTAVAGPTIVQKYHRGDTWGYLVEFVLVAAVPWLFGVTRPVDFDTTDPITVVDAPLNLVPYPSAVLTSGTVTAATNYSANPSAETNLTGWAATSTVVLPANVSAAAQAVAPVAAGTKSVTTKFTATNTSAVAGTIALENTSATFPAAVAGDRMSVSMFVFAELQTGTAVISAVELYAIFRAGTTVLGSPVLVGAMPAGGGAIAKKSIPIPATATNVILQARVTLASWSSGAIVNLYADAAAPTIP